MRYCVFLENRKNKNGLSQVYLKFDDETHKAFRVGTGLFTSTKLSGRAFSTSEPNHKTKTYRLNKILLDVDDYIIAHRGEPFAIQKVELQTIVKGHEVKPRVKFFSEYVDDFRATKTNESTATMYRITADKVREFDASATFDTITKDWLTKFETYFTKKGMSINGLAIHLRNIRTVFNWAIDNEWTEKYPFRRFKVKSEKVAIRNLTAEQIAQLRDYPVEPWQEIYRDMFMLSFYLCGRMLPTCCR